MQRSTTGSIISAWLPAAGTVSCLNPVKRSSFNRQIGPRLRSGGYKPAPVIIDGELLPGIGGGVCQVSTTLYNAVLLAGLEVLSRSPHSIPITYVPLGRDAAVAYDYMDLTFRNNSPYGVLLSARIDENRLTIKGIFRCSPGTVHRTGKPSGQSFAPKGSHQG